MKNRPIAARFIAPLAAACIFTMLPTFMSEAKTPGYATITIDSDMKEGMAVGDEELTVTSKSSNIRVKTSEITKLGNHDEKKSNTSKGDDLEEEEEVTDDGAWHATFSPEVTIELERKDKDDKLNLKGKGDFNLKGTAEPEFVSVSGNDSTVKLTVKLNCLKTGTNSLDKVKFVDGGMAIDFGETEEDVYYLINLYKGKTYIGQYTSGKGEDYMDLGSVIREPGTYTMEVKAKNTVAKTSTKWYKPKSKMTVSRDEISYLPKDQQVNQASYQDPVNTPFASITEGKWMQNGNRWWRLESYGSFPAGAWRLIKDHWYYFGQDGYIVTGCQNIKGQNYVFAPSGAMHTGWYKAPNGWHWLSYDGAMRTGWQKINDRWYYLSPQTGLAVTGYQQINGKTYYFAEPGETTVPECSLFVSRQTPDGRSCNSNGEVS